MPGRPEPDTLLAFDTATERMAVAVAARGVVYADDLPGGAAASAGLLPAIEVMLTRAGRTTQQISAVAFGAGPGAFTGLRTTCAVAQGLALGCGCPVLAIDSLRIVAEQARAVQGGSGQAFEVGVAMDARMGEVYSARYRWTDDAWHVIEAPALLTPTVLAGRWCAAPPAWSAGSGLELPGGALTAACPPARRIGVDAGRAAALLQLAQRAWQAGEGADAAQAVPLYLRDKVALTTAERQVARHRDEP